MDWMLVSSTRFLWKRARKLQEEGSAQSTSQTVFLILWIALIVVGSLIVFCLVVGIGYACYKRRVAKKKLTKAKASRAHIPIVKPYFNQAEIELPDTQNVSSIGMLIAARWKEDKATKVLPDNSFSSTNNASIIQINNKKEANQSFETWKTENTKREITKTEQNNTNVEQSKPKTEEVKPKVEESKQKIEENQPKVEENKTKVEVNKTKEVIPVSQKESKDVGGNQQPSVELPDVSLDFSRRFSFGEPMEHPPVLFNNTPQMGVSLAQKQVDSPIRLEESPFQDPKPYQGGQNSNPMEPDLLRNEEIQFSLGNSEVYKLENLATSPDRTEKKKDFESESNKNSKPKLVEYSNKNLNEEALNTSNLSITHSVNQSGTRKYVPRNYSSKANKFAKSKVFFLH